MNLSAILLARTVGFIETADLNPRGKVFFPEIVPEIVRCFEERSREIRFMIYPVVKYGNPILENGAKTVTVFDKELSRLLDDMFESMYAANGVGLAAPQIGIPQRIAVIDVSAGKDPASKLVLINPEIISTEGRQSEEEGCLSVPGFREKVKRPALATVRALDAKGKEFTMTGDGLLARAFCHETDHLNGRLFLSHLSALKRDLILRKIRKMMKADEWE